VAENTAETGIRLLSGGATDPHQMVSVELTLGNWILLGAALVQAMRFIPVEEDAERILEIAQTIGERMDPYLGPVDPAVAAALVSPGSLAEVERVMRHGPQDQRRSDA
jgi:hypothetical protein